MKLLTFFRMPYQAKGMFLLNFCLCGAARASTLCMSYARLSPYFGHHCQLLVASTLISQTQKEKAIFIARSVRLAARYTPWTSNCLTKALVAKFWCVRYDIPYILFIGVTKEKKPLLEREAHAWLTTGPVAVTGGDCLESHHVISSYSNVL